MNRNEDQISELILLFKRNNELLSVIAKANLAPVLARELSDKKYEKLYSMTGKKSSRDISKALKISVGAISNQWKKWEMLGLLIKDGKNYRRSF